MAFDVKFNKDEIAGNSPICLLPHDNADVDSVISCIMLSKLLDYMDIKNKICIFDKNIASDTDEILKKLGYNIGDYFTYDEDKNRTLILLDHYETKHLGNVIFVFDHHYTTSSVKSKYYYYKPSCATAYIIYRLMKSEKMPIDEHIVKMLAYAMSVDTVGFQNSKTVNDEVVELKRLLKYHNIDFETIRKESLLVNYTSNMSIEDIINNGRKDYIFNGYKVVSSYIQLDKELDKSMKKEILKNILNSISNSDIYLWVYIVYNISSNSNSHIYYMTLRTLLEENYEYIVSRGEEIIPKVEMYLK